MDAALLSLDQFIELEINHRPKLSVWLPGVALTILAESAGLSLEWLEMRQEDSQKGYARLPLRVGAAACLSQRSRTCGLCHFR